MESTVIISKLKDWVSTQIDSMSSNNPIIGFAKPIISRILNNNINKLSNGLKLLEDSSGNIDMQSILNELISNVKSSQKFTVHNSILGDIEIGEGAVKLNIPMTDKKIIFNVQDLELFKDSLI